MPVQPGCPRDQWEPISVRLEELKAVLPSLADLPAAGPDTAPALLARLAGAVEELRRRGIRDQIQVASVQEVTESLMRVRDPRKIFETLILYLRSVFDLEEILLIRRMPASSECVGYRVGRASNRVDRLGPVPWRSEWSEPILLRRSGPTQEESGLPGDRWDPSFYRRVLPLGRASAASSALANGKETSGPLGLLCVTPARVDAAEEEWRPAEIARRVEAVFENLRHREELEQEARYRQQLLQGMRDGVLALDREGRIVEANNAAARLLGLEQRDLRGRPASSLAGKLPALAAHLERTLRSQSEPEPVEIPAPGGDRTLPLNVAVSRLWDEEGRFAGLVVNLTDLSAVRTMEEEIRRLDRLAALGRFSAGVAHEIRNPLAGIEAGVAYLSGRIDPQAPEQVDFRFLRAEIQRLNRIITELLDYTRPRALDVRPAEAGQTVERIRQVLAPLLQQKRIRILQEGPERLVFWSDPDRIEQVLLNLVKNAVEASPEGSAVRVCWETVRSAGAGASRDGSGRVTRFRVIDQGEGMGPEEQARALEPFYTTKASGGTGLGLSVSHAIAEQHGGRLLLESSPGTGTIAVLEIPGQPLQGEDRDAIIHSDR